MAEEYGDFPGVEISTDEGDLEPGPSGHRYVHIDDFAESEARSNSTDKRSESDFESHDDSSIELHLYAFQSEGRREDLLELADRLKNDYVFATCIIWPDDVRDEIEQADTFRMRALEWAYVTMQYTDSDNLSEVADQAEQYLSRNDD
jgi:hypothetical protein